MARQLCRKEVCKIREFACFVGKLVAACPAVKYGQVYIKGLEREKFLALAQNGYNDEKRMSISKGAKEDID